MRSTFDFAPYRRSSIGFDRLFDQLENASRGEQGDGYPPYDVEQRGEDAYRISLAVAGFSRADIDITTKPNLLVVVGRRNADNEGNYLHRGIAMRAFERQFQLADYVKVTGAALNNGLLEIDLKREVPEAVKPRKIEISDSSGAQRLESEEAHEPA